MFFYIFFVFAVFSFGIILAYSLHRLGIYLFKIPINTETVSLSQIATKKEKAIYNLLMNIVVMQFVSTFFQVLFFVFLIFLDEVDISSLEALNYFVGSLLFNFMIFLSAILSANFSKKVFSILIIKPGEDDKG